MPYKTATNNNVGINYALHSHRYLCCGQIVFSKKDYFLTLLQYCFALNKNALVIRVNVITYERRLNITSVFDLEVSY